ncbi:MAG: T9SS type A sorting domain-containing protein [Ignavibacteria bacterium]|nr:T9SS type A sorting domain-containing protein [Ignavibacteria bacterium]
MIYNSGNNSPVFLSGSNVRWFSTDPAAIGNDVAFSGNGLYGVVGWGLNNERVALHNNTNSTPIWQYITSTSAFRNYVAVSDTAGVIAVGSYQNIYLFDKDSSQPFFNFDLTTTADTGVAEVLDITSDGNYVVASASRNDSSWVYCFNRNSTVSVWRTKIRGKVYGVRISGNDSLVIINGYYGYKVVNVYTGDIRAEGAIDNGNQYPLGISGNGNVIATGNYRGYLKVYQWNGSQYVQQWQFQEPPGTYYNWIVTIDISDDGEYIAAGTLNFLSSSSYDGKLHYFKRSVGSTPVWSYTGVGDEISFVKISKNGKTLVASSYGPLDESKDDILIFRADPGNGVPIFSVNSPGSLFMCDVSHDGTSAIFGGKAVHARIMGSGGRLYNIYVDTTSLVGIKQITSEIPDDYKLEQNYPNPFNPATKINFSIPQPDFVTLKVYNSAGKEIETLLNKKLEAGNYEMNFNADNLPSGVYFYRLSANNFTETKKMVVLK